MSIYLNQHLVNPENCLRCGHCEDVCPVGAISHDVNIVVDPGKCDACLECVAGCPTGAVDHWRVVPRERLYTLAEQHRWRELPPPLGIPAALVDPSWTAPRSPREHIRAAPFSASVPRLDLFRPDCPVEARVRVNRSVTPSNGDNDIHHIVLDFGAMPFPVLEGQAIGVLPPGADAAGRPHGLRLYSVASPRDGETAGQGDVALTVKRVTRDRAGRAVSGIASNFLCDLAEGATLRVTGPYGGSFLMPDDPAAKLLMIATGTGIAPIRAMIERRRRRGELKADRAVLFYGGRTPVDMPYHDELAALAPDGLELHLALSRMPTTPRRYVQNVLIERRERVVEMLRDPLCHLYLCGSRSMEGEVLAYLHRILMAAHIDWPGLRDDLSRGGRLHLESY